MTLLPDGHIAISYQAARLVMDVIDSMRYVEQQRMGDETEFDQGLLLALLLTVGGALPEPERSKAFRLPGSLGYDDTK